MTDDKPESQSQDPWVAEGRSRYSMQDLERIALDEKSSLSVRALALAELKPRLKVKGELP
ncbi:MAG TPA: hypothetical protein VM223_08505 [Planctomycetota bacterium]|nr:hypothetical protein [Planctomycetota bacterium]